MNITYVWGRVIRARVIPSSKIVWESGLVFNRSGLWYNYVNFDDKIYNYTYLID